METKRDIQKAVELLREVEDFFTPSKRIHSRDFSSIEEDVKQFTKHFPECWDCGDTGFADVGETEKCHCTQFIIMR